MHELMVSRGTGGFRQTRGFSPADHFHYTWRANTPGEKCGLRLRHSHNLFTTAPPGAFCYNTYQQLIGEREIHYFYPADSDF